VRASPARAALRAWCGVAAGHGAWKPARGGGARTVRPGGAGRARPAPPVPHGARCTVHGPLDGAVSAAWCGVADGHGAWKRARGGDGRLPSRTVHGPLDGAVSAAWCGVADGHGARKRVRGGGARTVRPRGAGRVRPLPPGRTVHGPSDGAVSAAWCGVADGHGARKRAPGGDGRTVRTGGAGPGRPRLPSRTVHGPLNGAVSAAWCGVADGHGARKPARGDDARTVRPGGAGPGRPAPPVPRGARCTVRRTVRCRPPGAALQTGTVRGSAHGVVTHARCGLEARGQAAPRLPSRTVHGVPDGAGSAAWCGVADGHGAWKPAPGDDPRTVRTGGAWRHRHGPPVRHVTRNGATGASPGRATVRA
jgi:hypothetical protein